MIKQICIASFTLLTMLASAQHKLQPIEQLINTSDPGWPHVQEWIKSAKNKVEVLPVDTARAKEALYQIQVTSRSPMGAIVYMTGGILVDDGWIRILGSGSAKLGRTLPKWNSGKSFEDTSEAPTFLLIADDAIGGFFLLNGGGLGKDFGKVYYISPDNLEYEPLEMTYSQFLLFCFRTDLDKFYEGNRWTNWREDVAKLNGDQVFNFFPPLWSKEGKDINKTSRKIVSVEEQYSLTLDTREQLGIKK